MINISVSKKIIVIQGTEESGQSVASSHNASIGEQQSVVASSESQLAEASGSGSVVSSHPPAEQSIAAVSITFIMTKFI